MRRRYFVGLLGGAAATWPLAGRAQQTDRLRRIGVLMSTARDDAEGRARMAAFLQGLQQLGWTDGRNLIIDWRYAEGNLERHDGLAAELVAMRPDLIIAGTQPGAVAAMKATATIPIVFVQAPDPVEAGLADSRRTTRVLSYGHRANDPAN